jgi:hypothetical protein
MNTQQNMDDRLWDYIDGTSGAEERSFIEQLIETNLEWKTKYKELLEVHLLMSNHLELDEPSMRFTQNVMEEIGKYHIAPAAKSYINKKIIWGIGTFFVLSIVGFLIYAFAQLTWTGSGNGELPVDLSRLSIDKVDFSKIFSNTFANIFMMINVVVGLMLLDMYLGKKKKQMQNESGVGSH